MCKIMSGLKSFDPGLIAYWMNTIQTYFEILKFCRLIEVRYFFIFCRWLLKALELYREMTLTDPQLIHTCSPHSIRKLVYTVLSESRAIGGFQLLDLIITELKSHMTC